MILTNKHIINKLQKLPVVQLLLVATSAFLLSYAEKVSVFFQKLNLQPHFFGLKILSMERSSDSQN